MCTASLPRVFRSSEACFVYGEGEKLAAASVLRRLGQQDVLCEHCDPGFYYGTSLLETKSQESSQGLAVQCVQTFRATHTCEEVWCPRPPTMRSHQHSVKPATCTCEHRVRRFAQPFCKVRAKPSHMRHEPDRPLQSFSHKKSNTRKGLC